MCRMRIAKKHFSSNDRLVVRLVAKLKNRVQANKQTYIKMKK